MRGQEENYLQSCNNEFLLLRLALLTDSEFGIHIDSLLCNDKTCK